jgi:hypothetical protein
MFHQKLPGGSDGGHEGGKCRRRADVVKCLKLRAKNLKNVK